MYEEEDSADAPMHDAMPEGTPDEATQATPIIGNKMHEGIKMEMEQMIAAIRQLFEEYGLAAPADEEAKAAAEELEDDTMRAMTEEEDEEGQKSVTLERLVRHLDANFDKVAKAVAEVQVNIRAQKAESRKDAFARAQQEAQLDKGQPENSKRNKAGAVHNENGASLGQIKMTDRRYANWTPEDFSFAAMLANKSRFTSNAAPLPIKLDNAFMGAFADAATKAHEQGTVRLSNAAIKGINMIKANELDHSTQVGFGDEWVPELWSDQIWERARQDNVILPLFQTTEMPSNPFVMPVEDADPDVYYVAETTAENQLTLADGNSPIPDSKIGTNNITLTAYKFGTRTGISAEFQEDAVPSSVPMFRRQAERALKDTIDNILVNGDTSSSNNINLDGGSPAANLPYRAFDGLIHNPLVDATSNAIDGTGGAPTLAKIRQARFALQAGSINALSDLVIIVDNATYGKLLGLDEFITMDKAGARATAQTGQIGFIDGIPVLATAEMALSATNGKVSSTGGNNLYGRLLIVDKRFWKVGYRRQITQTLDFIPYYDSWQLTTTVRLAFKNQNNDSTTLLYHLAV
jgi:N4-gp56 family major capsid protein